MGSEALNVPFDLSILANVGNLAQLSKSAGSEIRNLQREIARAEKAGRKLDSDMVARLKAVEQVKASADHQIRQQRQLRHETKESAHAIHGLMAVAGSHVLRKLMSGQSLDAGDVASGLLAARRPLVSIGKKLLGADNPIVKGLKAMGPELAIVAEALSMAHETYNKIQEEKKQVIELQEGIERGHNTRAEMAIYDYYNGDWRHLNPFHKDAQEALKEVQETASGLSSLHDTYGNERELNKGQKERNDRRKQQETFEKAARMVEAVEGTGDGSRLDKIVEKVNLGARQDAVDAFKKETGTLANRITKEVNFERQRTGRELSEPERADIVDKMIKEVFANLTNEKTEKLKDAFIKRLAEETKKAGKTDKDKPKTKVELEYEESRHHAQTFLQDNFKRQNLARWQTFRTPAHLAD